MPKRMGGQGITKAGSLPAAGPREEGPRGPKEPGKDRKDTRSLHCVDTCKQNQNTTLHVSSPQKICKALKPNCVGRRQAAASVGEGRAQSERRAGGLACWGRALAAIPEDRGLVLSTHVVDDNHF